MFNQYVRPRLEVLVDYPEQFDVIVIGVGAMGASACDQLASRGAKVLGPGG